MTELLNRARDYKRFHATAAAARDKGWRAARIE